ALSEHPLAEDKPLVPKARVLALERLDVSRVEVRVVVEAERPMAQIQFMRPIEIIPFEPVKRRIGVRRAKEFRPRQRKPGQQHREKALGPQRDLVAVCTYQREAADLSLCSLVVRAGEIHTPAKDVRLACAREQAKLVIIEHLGNRVQNVALERARCFADHKQLARRPMCHEVKPTDDACDGLAATLRTMPDVEPRIRFEYSSSR